MFTKRQLFDLVEKTYPCTKATVVDNRQAYRSAVFSCLSQKFPSAPEADLLSFVKVFCDRIAALFLKNGRREKSGKDVVF